MLPDFLISLLCLCTETQDDDNKREAEQMMDFLEKFTSSLTPSSQRKCFSEGGTVTSTTI